MNDFNLMLAEHGVYAINQVNGKFVFFASRYDYAYEALEQWKAGTKIGIYPPLVQGSFLIVRQTEPNFKLSVFVLCRDVPGLASSIDSISWKEVTL